MLGRSGKWRRRGEGKEGLVKLQRKSGVVALEGRGDEIAELLDSERRRTGVGGESHGEKKRVRRVGEREYIRRNGEEGGETEVVVREKREGGRESAGVRTRAGLGGRGRRARACGERRWTRSKDGRAGLRLRPPSRMLL